jgi:hypothetical protein
MSLDDALVFAAGVLALPVVGAVVLAGAGEFGLSGLVGSSGILASQTTSSSSHLQSHKTATRSPRRLVIASSWVPRCQGFWLS